MGLELEEMVVRLEDEFDIRIPDEDAVKLETVGQVIDYLMARPELKGKRSRDAVAESVWQVTEEGIGLDRKDFTEDSHFIYDMGAG